MRETMKDWTEKPEVFYVHGLPFHVSADAVAKQFTARVVSAHVLSVTHRHPNARLVPPRADLF
jgi:hypothetical protein